MSLTSSWRKRTLHFLSKNFTSHILLYHSCYPKIPVHLGDDLHNVTPENLYKQLLWYKKYYDIVPLSNWLEAKNKKGLVAVTFDDAYKSVFDYGLEVLESLNVPATIFIIGCTLEGKIFWRDKVRYIESKGLAEEFITHLRNKKHSLKNINSENFYSVSKKISFLNTISNSTLDIELDRFLESKNLLNQLPGYCIESIGEVIDHPLITYGNHTYHHYILSTLDYEEQKKDVTLCNDLIRKAGKSKNLNVLSIPFGGNKAFNSTTIKVSAELGFDTILLSNNSVNGIGSLKKLDTLQIARRFMVPDNFNSMIELIEKMTYNKFKKFKPGNR